MITQTSLLAYLEIKTELGARQRQVYNVLAEGKPLSNLDIANKLNMPINSITPRTKELREKGLVEQAFTAISPTGRRAIYWRTV